MKHMNTDILGETALLVVAICMGKFSGSGQIFDRHVAADFFFLPFALPLAV